MRLATEASESKLQNMEAGYDAHTGKTCAGRAYTYDLGIECNGWSGKTESECWELCASNAQASNCPRKTCYAAAFYASNGWCHQYEASECQDVQSVADATQLVANSFAFHGCFQDKEARELPHQAEGSAFTPDSCYKACIGYKYFGLQDGGQCFCGNGPEIGAALTEDKCNVACSAQPGTMCGGSWINSVYQAQAFAFRGCFQDNQNR